MESNKNRFNKKKKQNNQYINKTTYNLLKNNSYLYFIMFHDFFRKANQHI